MGRGQSWTETARNGSLIGEPRKVFTDLGEVDCISSNIQSLINTFEELKCELKSEGGKYEEIYTAGEEYDEDTWELRVIGWRWETAAEIEKRIALHEAEKIRTRDRELATLKDLKTKYPNV